MLKLLALLFVLCSLSTFAKVSFVAFGDGGYHYDYLKQKIVDNPINKEEFILEEYESWLSKNFPENEFKVQPMYTLPGTEHVVEASGAQPVADAMTEYCQTNGCDFAVMLGDNIYPNGASGDIEEDRIRFQKVLVDPYLKLAQIQQDFKMYAALGNHDWKTSRIGRDRQLEFGSQMTTAFTMKAPGYYSFTKGDVEFFVIDTNLLLAGTVVKENELNPDGSEKKVCENDEPEQWELPNNEDKTQLDWLESSLKTSSAKWKIVYGHHTLWSAGGSKYEQARSLRQLLMPMMCKYSDLYIAGHEHELEINIDTCAKELGTASKPLPFVVSGAAAWQRSVHHPFQSYQELNYPQYKALWSKGMVWGFSYITIEGDKLEVQMLTTPNDGQGIPVLEKRMSFSHRSQLR